MQSKIVKEIIKKYPATKGRSINNFIAYIEARLELIKHYRKLNK